MALYARRLAGGDAAPPCPDEWADHDRAAAEPWSVTVTVYYRGAPIARGLAEEPHLCPALHRATAAGLDEAGLDRADRAEARLVIELQDRDLALVEDDGRGLELTRGLVASRRLDAQRLREEIDHGKEYLFRVIHPEHGGVHKYYYAERDQLENQLYTIYTASWVYTMLKLHAHRPDPRIPERVGAAAEFILSMQSAVSDGRSSGAFHYSFDLDSERPRQRFVVGTAAKTIFTLLALRQFEPTGARGARYMSAAVRAADWLLTMQNRDGSVKPYLRWDTEDQRWAHGKQVSMLYTGQVLSALSRMYRAAGEGRYLDAADLTARFLIARVERHGCYLGDDYRQANPISSSWVVLSLLDFALATGDRRAQTVVDRCADELLDRQLSDERDIYRHGRWRRALSSSGNGWLAEVMSELYLRCREREPERCQRFETAITRVTRLLMQYTYTPGSAYATQNPAMAVGGVRWSAREPYVRTDSVCHAMNAYIHMIPHLDDGVLVELAEPTRVW
ncbi:MAG: terpene cyclase [Myxococcota bacterium]